MLDEFDLDYLFIDTHTGLNKETAAASCMLIKKLGAEVAGCAFVVELDALGGRAQLADYRVHTLVHY